MAYIEGQQCQLIKDWHVDSNWTYSSYSNRGSGSFSSDTFTFTIGTSYTTTHKIEPSNSSDKILYLNAGNYLIHTKLKAYQQYTRIPYTIISNASITHWGRDNWDGVDIGSSEDPNKSMYICIAKPSSGNGEISGSTSSPATSEYYTYFTLTNSQNVYFSLMFATWGYRSNHKYTFDNIELYGIN